MQECGHLACGVRAGGALIDGASGPGYRRVEEPALPPQMFDRREIEALVPRLTGVRLAGNPALAMITATLPERVQRQAVHAVPMTCRFERRAEAPVHLPLIRAAYRKEVALGITDEDKAAPVTRRRVWPLAIVFLDRMPMLLAFCQLLQDFRRFHLHRISAVVVLAESFRPRRVAMPGGFTQRLRAGGGE